MLKSIFQRQETVDQVKCVKCGRRTATREDKLCDSCRFTVTIDAIFDAREQQSK